MAEHQHHRKLGDLAGLQRAKARQHQPALAAIVFRHKQHQHQQHQRKRHQRPCQPVIDVVIHLRGRPHSRQPHSRIQKLRADIGIGIAPAVNAHGVAGAEQCDQPKAQKREHQNEKRHIRCRILPKQTFEAVFVKGSGVFHAKPPFLKKHGRFTPRLIGVLRQNAQIFQ